MCKSYSTAILYSKVMSLSLIEAKVASQPQLAKKGGEVERRDKACGADGRAYCLFVFLPPLILQMVSLSMLANIQRLVVNFVSALFYIYLEKRAAQTVSQQQLRPSP